MCEHRGEQKIRDFTETMIFELSVNIGKGKFPCGRGEQDTQGWGGLGVGKSIHIPTCRSSCFREGGR